MADTSQSGGFIAPTGLASPVPSTVSSTRSLHGLPHPRSKPLRPNTNKEDLVRRYVEERLFEISRRYVKKFGRPDPKDTVVGYKSFRETCKDMDNLVNVLWLSGTPSLQIPFLFKLSSDFTQYVGSFPPSPKASFDLLRKLDHCFSSLLQGKDIESGEPLPGFENGLRGGMTITDMIRCRSLVEQSRLLMVEVLSKQANRVDQEDGEDDSVNNDDDDEEEEEEETDNDTGYNTESTAGGYSGSARWDIDEERLHLDAARIFEHTIVQLNNRLGDRSFAAGPGIASDANDMDCGPTGMADADMHDAE